MLKFDEFMAHFDPLKVLNGETKCSKAPKKSLSALSTTSKKGAGRLQRGEATAQTALSRFSDLRPTESTLRAMPATSANQSKVHSVSKSRTLLTGRKPSEGDNTGIVDDDDAEDAFNPATALAELQRQHDELQKKYDEVLAENGVLKETVRALKQVEAEMQAEIQFLL